MFLNFSFVLRCCCELASTEEVYEVDRVRRVGERVDRSTYVLCSRLTSSLGFAYRERERECALIYLGYIIVLVQLVL